MGAGAQSKAGTVLGKQAGGQAGRQPQSSYSCSRRLCECTADGCRGRQGTGQTVEATCISQQRWLAGQGRPGCVCRCDAVGVHAAVLCCMMAPTIDGCSVLLHRRCCTIRQQTIVGTHTHTHCAAWCRRQVFALQLLSVHLSAAFWQCLLFTGCVHVFGAWPSPSPHSLQAGATFCCMGCVSCSVCT